MRSLSANALALFAVIKERVGQVFGTSITYGPQQYKMIMDCGKLFRGPRKIEAASNRRHLWGEQHRIEPRTKRNHWRANLGCLTSDDHFS
jgi:hypothetical protein